MNDEIASLYANGTWTLEDPPCGVKPIPTKWVYTVKYDAAGNVERFKARLVAQGFRQREGVDFQEVFAPVSKYSTLRALLAIAAANDMELQQLDITTAFLNGELAEEVYVLQPPGFEDGTGRAAHLHRALYGLRQAPRAWHARLKEELERIGFVESLADPGLFIFSGDGDGDSLVYVLVYVDDILIASKQLAAVQRAKAALLSAFKARDLGEATLFLGMQIARDRATRTIKLSQPRMAADLAARFGVESARARSTPLSAADRLTAGAGEPLDLQLFPYSTLVGSLLYLSICTRPDIAFSVGALAKYMAAPTTAHWAAAKGVLRYVACTSEYGINFGGTGAAGLQGFCDADYAGDTDTRRSTTGYVFTLHGGAITWSSRRQQTVAASTSEAEYMAAAHAVKEALWLRKLAHDLRIEVAPISIQADNQSAIKLLKNPISSMRSKHIDVIYHFARERVARKEVVFSYISTGLMIADSLTKVVPAEKHNFCRKGMGVF